MNTLLIISLGMNALWALFMTIHYFKHKKSVRLGNNEIKKMLERSAEKRRNQ